MKHELNRREFIQLMGAGTGALMAGSQATAPDRCQGAFRGERPNIVFILADDLGWKDVAFMGSRYYETPNIDRLAGEGIIFTQAYTNGPNCAPTRASLMSGQYTPRHGVYTVGSSQRGASERRRLIPVENKTTLDSQVVTLAEALKPAGYVSASMGKWHLGNDPELGPIGQGFDVNVGGYEAGHPNSYFSPYRNPTLDDGPPGEYLTDRLTDEAIKFMSDHRDRPFFLYLPHYAVHTPLQAKEAMIKKYKSKAPSNGQGNAKYAAMIESLDRGVGRIMGALDDLGLAPNTVVVFYSDNGGVRNITSMQPLRGGKGMLYEGGIRVPLVVRWPSRIQAGTTCDEPVIGVDFYPTILEIAGVRDPRGQVLDGRTLAGLLTGGTWGSPRALYWHFPAYLQGRAEGARDPHFRTRPAGAVRYGPWKLIEYFEDGTLELYHLEDDIGETHNRATEVPQTRQELHKMMRRWRDEVRAPVPVEPNPDYDPLIR